VAVLQVRDLSVEIPSRNGVVRATQGVSFAVEPGERLGIVGESGSGKTITALALMRLLLPPASITAGEVWLEDRNLLTLTAREMVKIRGNLISMIFQDPMTALNPFLRIGIQVSEVLEVHRGMSRREALEETRRLLELVQVSDAERRLREFPHQLSGGMRQRVVIAAAIAARPKLIIADEPTTALDVTAQALVLDLLRQVAVESGTAVMLITHDLSVVADFCDRVVVMYAGRVMELGDVESVIEHPRHPYTLGLLDAIPRLDRPLGKRLASIPGAPPDLSRRIVGCPFAPRCPMAVQRCHVEEPALLPRQGGGVVACHRADELEDRVRPRWEGALQA